MSLLSAAISDAVSRIPWALAAFAYVKSALLVPFRGVAYCLFAIAVLIAIALDADRPDKRPSKN